MNKCAKAFLVLAICLNFSTSARSETIYHEKFYPDGSGPFPAVIALHTSGGFKTVKHLIQRYLDDGFVVYAPDFFTKHGITTSSRMNSFDLFRVEIEKDLSEIVDLIKEDLKVDAKNVFATGFSNGGFWVCYLTGNSKVTAGVAHYSVWKANFGREMTNPYPMHYFSKSSAPILALHGNDDDIQKLEFAEEAWEEIIESGAKLQTHVYAGAGHAWDRKYSWKFNYIKKIDKDSHRRTIKFFKKHMK